MHLVAKEFRLTRLQEKERRLFDDLGRYSSLMVAVSGGVDSMYLLYAAHKALGSAVVAVTAVSALHPEQESRIAGEYARNLGLRHVFVTTGQMDSGAFIQNTRQRCYVCKKLMFAAIAAEAGKYGIRHLAHGANRDDEADFRPGLQACREMGVLEPLAAAGLTKADIRALSRRAGLSTWDKPASGCLATRIPYGTPITRENLGRIARSEQALAAAGFGGSRVRFHGDLAKIEVPADDLLRIMQPGSRAQIVSALRRIGFLYVTLDMEGFASGRLNRAGEAGASEGGALE